MALIEIDGLPFLKMFFLISEIWLVVSNHGMDYFPFHINGIYHPNPIDELTPSFFNMVIAPPTSHCWGL